MSKLNKVLFIFLVVHYTKATPWFDHFISESDESDGSDCYILPKQECPEGQSLISSNDLIVLLNYVVKRSNVVEDIVDGYQDKFMELNNKYLDELNEFQKRAEDNKDHLNHIFESIENLYQTLEPIAQGIAGEIDKIDVSEEHVSDVDNNLEKLLTKYQMFQKLCEINGIGEKSVISLKNKLVFKSSNGNLSFEPICENIDVIYAQAMNQLNEFRNDSISGLESMVLQVDEHLKDLVISYNNQLKEGALMQYNSLMYDILKLQDGYFHLNHYYSNFSLTSKLDAVEDNVQEVISLLVEIENSVNEYGQMCMNSVKNVRVPRGKYRSFKVNSPENELILTSSDIIDAAISIKIKEVWVIVQNNITGIFEEIEERLLNPEVIEYYIQKLAPSEEDMKNIEIAREKINELKKLIPLSSFMKLQDLYVKSEHVLQKAENAREEIDATINKTIMYY